MNRASLLGAGFALAGLAVVVVPSLAVGVPATYATVLLVGVLAIVLGVGRARRRLGAERDRAALPEREAKHDHPVPGDEFDAELAAIDPRRDRANDAARAQVRERLEVTALAVLTGEGYAPEVARNLLDAGEWTDDPVAASFFAADEGVSAGDDVPLRQRLGSSIGMSASFDRRARRTARAIAARAEATDG